jgi:hypothetical protein
VRALPADRQALAVAQTAEATEIHQALDVHRDLAAQVAFDLQLAAFDHLADPARLVVIEIVGSLVQRNLRLGEDVARERLPDPVDVSERDLHPLVARKIDACQTRHA